MQLRHVIFDCALRTAIADNAVPLQWEAQELRAFPGERKGFVMKLKDCRYEGSGKFRIADYPTSAKVDKASRAEIEAHMAANIEQIVALQDKLYAQGTEGVLVMIQAMDAAGKDGTIKHVMSGLNPQGMETYSFKQPSKEELAHDYLWRAVCHLPKRGNIGLFNRSYYEDVLVVRVHGLWHGYAMPKRCLDMDEDEFFAQRYRQIVNFEDHLYENGYRLLKVYLHLGLEEQKKRFIARIDEPAKNWKFSAGDLDERDLWPQYMDAFEACIANTSTERNPWYVIPADQKFYARYLVSQALLETLEACDPQYPQLSAEELAGLEACRARLG